MDDRVNRIQQIAKRKFMRHPLVCGVGVKLSRSGHMELIFLLERKSNSLQDEVRAWARKRNVGVRFLVTGKLQISSLIDR
jgi:hypothetical protein